MTPSGDAAVRPVVLAVENDRTCPPAMVGGWLAEIGLDVQVARAHHGDEVPSRVPDGVSAVLALGGEIGAHDEASADWLIAEKQLLRDAVDRGVPVLGLCLGGQLLAAATGGDVSRSEIAEVGVSEVSRTIDGLADPVIAAAVPVGGDTVPSAQWHVDRITRLPEGAVLLMANDACPVQAFRLGETAYGLQMHPEVDARIFTEWVDDAAPTVDRCSVTTAEALDGFLQRQDDLITAWRPAIQAWGALVWKRDRALGAVSGP